MTPSDLKIIMVPYPSMTIRQLAVLLVLYKKKKMKLKDIAADLGVPKPSICRAFDGLCIAKLMERIRDDEDGRQVYGVLTGSGLQLAGALWG